VDISTEILQIAETAIYTNESSNSPGRSIFERLSEAELNEIFDWNGK
jgi:hypothetical protein